MNPVIRRLGTSDLSLTSVGLGTWAMGGGDWKMGWGPQDERHSIDTIHAALDVGINWIDTAAVYGLGRSEEVVGKALAGMSERPIIATKCGRVQTAASTSITGDLSRESIQRECEASLRRLRIDTIDLYQIHWPDPDEGIEEAWQSIADLQQAGKIRWGGVSNFSREQLQRVHNQPGPVISNQPPYSLLRRDIEAEILPWCREHDVGTIAYSPMTKGMLTGKVTAEWVAALPESDHRKTKDPMFREPRLTEILHRVADWSAVASDLSCSLAQCAIAWVTHQPGVTAAIVGGRRPEQIRETAKAMDLQIPAEVIDRLSAI